MTLWRWLERAVKDGRVLVSGTGRRNEPWVYWLPGMEEVWANDPVRLHVDDLGPVPPLFETLGLKHGGPIR